jgi:hypothetical protein
VVSLAVVSPAAVVVKVVVVVAQAADSEGCCLEAGESRCRWQAGNHEERTARKTA